MKGDFNIIIPLEKGADELELVGIASTDSIDRDDERMSDNALNMMVDDINTVGVNLFGNHEHSWENTLGSINKAKKLEGKKVGIKIDLDDPSTNLKVPMLLNKLKRGIRLGLSVGGTVTSYKEEYDKKLGKKIKVLDSVKIYEVSVVGIPSNADAFVTLPTAIAKSAGFRREKSCPMCFSKMEKRSCDVCLYKGV